jgi:hypothetical protein
MNGAFQMTETKEQSALDLLNKPEMSHETAVSIFTSAVQNPADVTADTIRESLQALGLSMTDLRRDRNLLLQLEGVTRELGDAEAAEKKAMAAVNEHNKKCVPVKEEYDRLVVAFRQLECAASAASGKCNHLAGKRSDLIQSLNRNFEEAPQSPGRMSFPRSAVG